MRAEEERPLRVPVVQQLLEANLRQGQVNKEIAKELQNLCLAPVAATPVPNPSQEVLHILTKPGADNDVEAFQATSLRVARREQ